MHKLNFCKSLCLPKPSEGHDCHGMDIIHEFPEAVLIPMAGIATPLHILYASRPVMYKNGEARILQTTDLDPKEKLDALCSDPEAEILAPDHALDLDPRADTVFANRENSLKYVIQKLFSAGYKRVAIWANNGIGRNATEESSEDGVIRDSSGAAVKTRLNRTVQPFYQKGIPESYQNTAHQHIHIAPVPEEYGSFDDLLLRTLENLHYWHDEPSSLEKHRNTARENTTRDHLPGITMIAADSKIDNLDEPLGFFNYPASACFLWPQYNQSMSGLTRTLVLNHTQMHARIELGAAETKKEHIQRTKEFYQEMFSS
ncbi:hypothetical protein GF343_06030 [Candidatus Woesearchaeota archaeon]|nr:hypothetical protein [Candidatus Woesearchaeota archaeon]